MKLVFNGVGDINGDTMELVIQFPEEFDLGTYMDVEPVFLHDLKYS